MAREDSLHPTDAGSKLSAIRNQLSAIRNQKSEMTTKYSDIMAALRADKYAPIYVLCGEEPYYIDRVYDFIATHALDEMAREFDQQTVYGRDLQGADIAPVISAARGYAMMGGRKVVIVREAQAVKKWEALEAYLNVIMPQTVLVT